MELSYLLHVKEKLPSLDRESKAEFDRFISKLTAARDLSDLGDYNLQLVQEDFEKLPVFMIKLNSRTRVVFTEKDHKVYLLSLLLGVNG